MAKKLSSRVGHTRGGIDVWWKHHSAKGQKINKENPIYKPPSPVKPTMGGGVDYTEGGSEFVKASHDSFHLMHLLMVCLVPFSVAPTRWHWETLLMLELKKHGPVSRRERELAMIVCLILASATMDEGCITATSKLKEAKLLSPEALNNAESSEIFQCIKDAGIGNVSTGFLKELGRIVVEERNGELPETFEDLLKIPGIGEKAGNIGSGEIFHNIEGIGVDRHVENIAIALGYHLVPTWLKASQPSHVETSLRTWVGMQDYKIFNPVMGGMAQLFTKTLRSISKEKEATGIKVISAMADHFHVPYHVELLWFCIGRIRQYYLEKTDKIQEVEKADKGNSTEESTKESTTKSIPQSVPATPDRKRPATQQVTPSPNATKRSNNNNSNP